ncbi:hypothetical protein OHB26_27925 [Nocardia sp. NBC_01503]|uniref:hypothetical protein n=1 Tax=Nocardia sp. NBC_01503 TaxID=2975997 RepID=UPI002E7BE049|nr:hypothetical protein [Nocardia sp. NBC_01503]WTL30735.1 hypothetical protein OHB26_27925 [Nocardia sp. NBC_01503]
MGVAHKLGVLAAIGAAAGMASTGTAAADATTIPFQINPAPFGIPTGSFDAPAGDCAAVVGDQPGVVLITGGRPGGWGCPLSSNIRWINLSTGATGAAQLSDGLNGIPSAATINTGPGQVALILTTVTASTITPGLATFYVP